MTKRDGNDNDAPVIAPGQLDERIAEARSRGRYILRRTGFYAPSVEAWESLKSEMASGPQKSAKDEIYSELEQEFGRRSEH